MKQKYFFKFLLLISVLTINLKANSQTVVDDFTDGNFTSNQTWSGSTTEFSIITAATLPDGSASTDASYLASNASQGDVSLAFASTEVSEWRFSLGSPNFNPSGTNYIGVVLMASAIFSGDLINDNATNNFQGYYIRIGDSAGDPIELWRKTGTGESHVGDFPNSPSFSTGALQNGLNIRVTRSATGVFELFYSTGFQYNSLPITSAGTLTNNAYSTSTHFGVFQNIGTTSSSRRVYIDNIQLGVVTWDGSDSNAWATAANWDTNSTPVSTDNVIIPNSLTNYPTAASAVTINSVIINSGATLIGQNSFVGTITYNRNLGTTNWYLVSSPVHGEIMTDMIANNSFKTNGSSEVSFAPYDNSQAVANDRWAYFGDTATDLLQSGKGFSASLSAAGNISFSGDFIATGVSITIRQGGGSGNNFNLVGNPYPSYINSGTILTNESAKLVSETIWLWDQSGNGGAGEYITRVTANAFKVAPTQGFFVEANTLGNFTFTEAMQSHESTDTFLRSSRPEIKLLMKEGTSSKYAEIYYINGTTTGFDNGYDGEMFGGVSNPFAVYTHLVTDSQGKDYQIQSLPDSGYENMVVPVGVNAASGKEITFSTETMNLPSGIKVYLEDKNDNSFTRLDEANSEYKITLDSDLNGIGRFYLHTTSSVLNTPSFDISSVSIYKTSKTNLRITGLQSGNASVNLFNILGKRVYSNSFTAKSVNDINLPELNTGIYIVQLVTEQGKISKKIIIE